MFIGSFTDDGEQTLRRLRKSLPAAVRTFIANYHSGLSAETEADPRFEFRLRVMNELAPKDPDALALQFTKYHEMTEEQRTMVEELGRKGMVISKERQRGIVGHGLKKPTRVVAEVAAAIPYKFTMGQFTKAWKTLKVRPPTGDDHPEITDEKYCIYDERHNDYGYTTAYATKLIRKCSTEKGFRKLLGTAPRDKITGEWVGEPPIATVPPWRREPTSAVPSEGELAGYPIRAPPAGIRQQRRRQSLTDGARPGEVALVIVQDRGEITLLYCLETSGPVRVTESAAHLAPRANGMANCRPHILASEAGAS